jgi:hypothetical protein
VELKFLFPRLRVMLNGIKALRNINNLYCAMTFEKPAIPDKMGNVNSFKEILLYFDIIAMQEIKKFPIL